VIRDRETGRLACRAGKSWQTLDYAQAAEREKHMADAEAVRLLYVAATRARDHLVLSLFRGRRAESSPAASIERRLSDADEAMCTTADVPEYVPSATDEGSRQPCDAPGDDESAGTRQRLDRITTASAPLIHDTSSSSEQIGRRDTVLHLNPKPGLRRNVSLLAQVEDVLLEAHLDAVYGSAAGHVLVLRQTDDDSDQVLRAGLAALAFEVATGCKPAAIEVISPDGSTRRLGDVAAAATLARADLLGVRSEAQTAR
jgi:hypothetical protein